MNSFLKSFLAALLAFVVGSILCVVIFSMIFAGMAALFTPKAPVVSSNSVLKIDLGSSIVDSPGSVFSNVDFFDMKVHNSLTLLDAITAIDAAAVDSKIKGIYISLDGEGSVGISNIEELRAAIERFKTSGKFVVAYDTVYGHAGYYLASVADKVVLNPEGVMQWTGLSASVMFYKGLLDKLGVEVDILRHGSFKSAIEPYVYDKMSPENRLQMTTYVNSLWGVLLSDISASRGISVEQMNSIADGLSIDSAEAARRLGFVDELWYSDQMINYLGALADGIDTANYDPQENYSAPEFISLGSYAMNVKMANRNSSRNRIAVIYADGQIIDGQSGNKDMGGDTVAALLAQARKDDGIKAVVLRVNSPGGSALASEIIWREMELLKKEKPVVVSMGGYAASGGYYISAPADVILADRTTLTGSIGVFGMMMSIEKTLKDKIGITVDVVETNAHSSMGNGFGLLSPEERAYFMRQIEATYNTFVGHVSDGRNMTTEAVDAIGQGRVWLGVDAMNIGLIDGHGGLWDAIALAVDRVGIEDDFRVVEITDNDSSLISILFGLSASIKEAQVRDELGDLYIEYRNMKDMIRKGNTIQALMPYRIDVR